MEYGSRLRLVVISIVSIFILILLGWGIATIAQNIFSGDTKKTTTSTEETDSSTVTLSDIDTQNTTMKLTVEGAVVASDLQRSLTIEVGRNEVVMKVYKDYGKTVIKEAKHPNNIEAFEAFVKSLESAKFTRVREGADVTKNDPTGKCADGRRYIIEVKSIDESVVKLWSTSCSVAQGTAGGNMPRIRALFKKQVPEYTDLVKDLSLN